MSKRVCVPLADGFEEIEAVTIIDILRRAKAEVFSAGLNGRSVRGSHGISIDADMTLDDAVNQTWDLIALPGGVPGAPNLAADERVLSLLRQNAEQNRHVAAVCAAPYALDQAGLTMGKHITSHPNWAKKIANGDHIGARTVIDGKMITGQAAGSAMEFAFRLVEALFGPEKVTEINRGVLAALPQANGETE